MALKKTDMERLKAASITDRLNKSASPARYGAQYEMVTDLLERGMAK
jgi:hypothetical protein